MTKYFTFNQVSQAAEKILQCDYFDMDLVYSDMEDLDSKDSDSSSNTDLEKEY